MKKIVYLHGLESKSGGPKVSFLAEKGTVYAPKIDYKTLDLNEFILSLGMPDLIIGSQLGVDVLLFNPALHSRSIDTNYGVNYGTETYKRTIVLGTKDNIIDPEETKMLWPVGYNKAKFEEIEGMGHRTPLDVFINMYNKHA